MILVGVYNLQKNGGGIIMKRLIAITLFICLLLCGCQAANPTPTESAAESDLVTSKAPAVESTEVTTEDITESTSVQPKKVTVYLLEKAVFFDSGYTEYYYDKNNNIDTYKTFSIENELMTTVNFVEKDKNGMACMLWEDEGDVLIRTYLDGGKLKEEQRNSNETPYTGYQYEYDKNGNVINKREYYDGILQSTVIYEYKSSKLYRVYCEDPQENRIFDCRVENGVIIEKVCYSSDSSYSYRYEYDSNGNLTKETFIIDGEAVPGTTYQYKSVKVDANRAQYLQKQQQYLFSIT